MRIADTEPWPTRTKLAIAMLALSAVAVAVAVQQLTSGGLGESLGFMLAALTLTGLVGAIVLLVVPTRSVRTATILGWSAPGLLAVAEWIVAASQRVVFVPLGSLGEALSWSQIIVGPISPLTSVAATIYAGRSRTPFHVGLCVLSWAGAIMFWGHSLGLLLPDW